MIDDLRQKLPTELTNTTTDRPGDDGTAMPGTEPKPVGIFNYGWICPVCGRGNSPYTSSCPCRPSPPFTITCGVVT